MAPKWQENAVLQPCIQGKIRAVFRERNVLRLGSLVIYFGPEREWRHFCFSGWFREGFSFLTVCWHAEMCAGNEKLRSRCQRRARGLPSSGHWWLLQTLRYKRVNVSCQIFYDLKNSSGTFWNGSFFFCLSAEVVQTSKSLTVTCGSAVEGFETTHYWFITIYSSMFCGLKEHQVCTVTNFFFSTSLADRNWNVHHRSY